MQENVRAIRVVLNRIDAFTIPSHVTSPIVHIYLRSATPSFSAAPAKAPNPATLASSEAPSFDIAVKEGALQDIGGQGARAGRVDHAGSPVAWAGARCTAPEHPPRCDGGAAVAQGVRAARCWHYQGCGRKGTREAEMRVLATSARYLQSISHTQSGRVLHHISYLQLSLAYIVGLNLFVSR
jgi:hypothetical protein